MYNTLALAAALWPATATQYCPPQENTIIIGVAVNPKNKFLYCEYFSNPDKHKIHVDYIRNGDTFATKELDYSINPTIPIVKQIDNRTGERRESVFDDKNIELIYQENNDKKIQTISLAVKDIDVVDAGFDQFVKSNWNELTSGKTLSIAFASMVHQKSLPLRVSSIPPEQCKAKKDTMPASHCFSVDIDNTFLRILLSNIKISYDQQHRLLQFDGVVNLQDDAGKSQSAVINYFYKDDYLSDKK